MFHTEYDGDLAVARWRRKRLAGLPMEDDGPTSGSAEAIVFPRAVHPKLTFGTSTRYVVRRPPTETPLQYLVLQ
jgi:hypothetical protein